jgi:hypothetical protein
MGLGALATRSSVNPQRLSSPKLQHQHSSPSVGTSQIGQQFVVVVVMLSAPFAGVVGLPRFRVMGRTRMPSWWVKGGACAIGNADATKERPWRGGTAHEYDLGSCGNGPQLEAGEREAPPRRGTTDSLPPGGALTSHLYEGQ